MKKKITGKKDSDNDKSSNKRSKKASCQNDEYEKIYSDVDDDHNQIYDSNTLYKRCLLK